MKTIRTEIEIDAPAERVWGILTDFAAFPTWNPFVTQIEGKAAVGERLSVSIQPPGSKGMRFAPTVLEATPNKELRWMGRLLLPGIFDGEHTFRIEALGINKVRFIQEEKFQGVLVSLFAKNLDSGTPAGFTAMNQALKAHAERVTD